MDFEKYVKVYKLDREIHMVGDSVAVCWNCNRKMKTIEKDGVTYKGEVHVRQGTPYIDFVSLREYDDGEFFEDEDKPVDGGLSKSCALQIANELKLAYEYINYLEENHKI